MLKKLLIVVGFSAVAAVMHFGNVFAAPYGGGNYGQCKYGEGCNPPAVIPPPSTPSSPPLVTPPDSRQRDIDNDGIPETATDSNKNEADGFEDFNGTNATVIEKIDGDSDGKTDFILNTDEDPFPERYWDPDDDVVSTIQLTDCNNDGSVEWRFNNGKDDRTYDPIAKKFIENCDTPSRPNSNPGSTGNSRTPSSGKSATQDKNRLTQILPLISNSPAYESVGEAIRRVPEPIAYGFPYFLFFLIILLIIRLAMQSHLELKRVQIAAKTQKAEQQLVVEKSNFMMLSSHYLRTPLTIIQGNIELMQSLKQINEDVGKTLASAGKLLMDQVGTLLTRIEEDKKLSLIQATTINDTKKTFISPRLVLPLIFILCIFALGQFLFIDFRVVAPRLIDTLIQAVLLVLLIQTFLSKLRQRQLSRRNREDQEKLLQEQRALDEARSKFITDVADNLDAQLLQFRTQLAGIIDKPEAAKVKNALGELSRMIAKFRLVAYLEGAQLQTGKEQFTLREVVEQAIGPYVQNAQTRAISVTNDIENGQVFQQKQLLSIILSSLMDNAMKFTPDDGEIEIAATNSDGNSIFTVKDNGSGIPKDKLEFLFKPFSRTDSVEQFNSEGLGFSLYLDKVIANYLQGDISVNSAVGEGTTVTLSVPAQA